MQKKTISLRVRWSGKSYYLQMVNLEVLYSHCLLTLNSFFFPKTVSLFLSFEVSKNIILAELSSCSLLFLSSSNQN